jgi:hypothetical protein
MDLIDTKTEHGEQTNRRTRRFETLQSRKQFETQTGWNLSESIEIPIQMSPGNFPRRNYLSPIFQKS